jgi:staphylococcal nuclease domain-containing protein 1
MGSASRGEEPFAFEAREFLREKIVGKKCEFHIEYSYNNRDYGNLVVDGENLNLAIIQEGLAKVVEKRGTQPASRSYDELMAAQ